GRPGGLREGGGRRGTRPGRTGRHDGPAVPGAGHDHHRRRSRARTAAHAERPVPALRHTRRDPLGGPPARRGHRGAPDRPGPHRRRPRRAPRGGRSVKPFPLTWLYAPGDRPAVVRKALTSGADVVVIDLEDAVAPDRKAYARAATAELLRDPQPVPVHVRVNALSGPWARDDLAAVAPAPGLSGLRLPKVSSPSDVVRVAHQVVSAHGGTPPLYALLETALGIERAHAVATAHPSL